MSCGDSCEDDRFTGSAGGISPFWKRREKKLIFAPRGRSWCPSSSRGGGYGAVPAARRPPSERPPYHASTFGGHPCTQEGDRSSARMYDHPKCGRPVKVSSLSSSRSADFGAAGLNEAGAGTRAWLASRPRSASTSNRRTERSRSIRCRPNTHRDPSQLRRKRYGTSANARGGFGPVSTCSWGRW